MKKIVAFAGSNSSKSINLQLVRVLAGLAKETEVEVLDLRDFEAPMFGADLFEESGIPSKMEELAKITSQADGFLIATPEHNGSMPAVLKNTFDWLSKVNAKFLFEKPTVFVSTSPGARGGQSALKHLVEIMPYRGAKIVGNMSFPSFNETIIDGEIANASIKEQAEELIHNLEAAVNG